MEYNKDTTKGFNYICSFSLRYLNQDVLCCVCVVTASSRNVSAGCVGWGKYVQIRAKDIDTFSATLREHLCFDYLCHFPHKSLKFPF